ncbi:hypothetical protein ACS5PK_19635 [Roseateles sp. DB2]|uniref:hypothetical protein n=1 Tax=Roseateles sp. DB2 TaxID=3453717 RepID=UPI003EE8F45E
MKWRKLGKIFDPRDHQLANRCVEFAQSPQVLVLPDAIRVYFSTRERDEATGKFLSHIAFAEFSRDFSRVLRVNAEPVIPLGELGTFDEHGIFPMQVLPVGDEVWGYTCGWSRRSSVSVETAIGLAISRDGGLSFERTGPGPVLGPSPQEPFLVGDGFVQKVGGTFHMWYIFGTHWTRYAEGEAPDRVYKIGHAQSPDGVHWTKDEGQRIIGDRLGADECQALPSVIRVGERWLMAFCYRHAYGFRTDPTRGYRIGHAWSDDLKTWQRCDDEPLLETTPGQWDSDMNCYPHVCEVDGRIYLLYNGNQFGREGFGLAVLEP